MPHRIHEPTVTKEESISLPLLDETTAPGAGWPYRINYVETLSA